MEVVCQHCSKKINVPDEKIPKKASFSFNCPACKGKITVQPKDATQPVAKAPVVPKKAVSAPPRAATDDDGEATTGVVFEQEAGKPGAMVCDPTSAKLKALLEGLGYQVHTPGYHIEAINNLKFNQYRVIIVTAEFEELPHDHESIFELLQNLTMERRRKMFVIYVAPGLKTFDDMEAFAYSMNALVASADIGKPEITERLKKAIVANDRFFKVFNETLVELGKG